MWFFLFMLATNSMLRGVDSAEWSSTSPHNGAVTDACSGGSVTLLWDYVPSCGDVVADTEWFFKGNSTQMVANFFDGRFYPKPPFTDRVQLVGKAAITVRNLTVADAGNYSVTVYLCGSFGDTHSDLHRSVSVRVNDQLQIKNGNLKVTERSEAVLDPTTGRWAIQLHCGTFTFTGDPPYQVEWLTPSGDVVNSSDYSNNHFNLLLTRPIQGGNYICRIPHHRVAEACPHDNDTDHLQASVHVDQLQSSLLSKDIDELKTQLNQSRSDIEALQAAQAELRASTLNLTGLVSTIEGRISEPVGFHCQGLEGKGGPYYNDTLVLINVLYNEGNGYDRSTGFFTVPVPGVYIFIATTATRVERSTIQLMINDYVISHADLVGVQAIGSVHGVIRVNQGDTVWLRCALHGGHFYAYATTFIGFLLSP